MLAIFRLGLGWWRTFLMQRVGPWIKGSRIQNGSRRWVGRWEVLPPCERWKCGPISLRAALMNLDPPTRGRAFVSFSITGPTYYRVGVAAREMPITTRTGTEKSRHFIMSMQSALPFSSVKARTILESRWLTLTRW